MANVDAANGDTEYTLTGDTPFTLGNKADGSGFWLCNVDPTAVITAEWSGSHAGLGRINLSAQGDWVWIPAGDVTIVTVRSNVYPCVIGWAYTDPGMVVRSGFAETGILGAATGVVDVINSATGAAAAIAATLPAVAGHTNYLAGFEVTGAGATAASVIAVTVTGVVGGTITYYIAVPAGVTTSITPLVVEFSRPLAASGPNVAIAVNVASFGAGNTSAAVVAHGFRQ